LLLTLTDILLSACNIVSDLLLHLSFVQFSLLNTPWILISLTFLGGSSRTSKIMPRVTAKCESINRCRFTRQRDWHCVVDSAT